jgi:hypothetical protein
MRFVGDFVLVICAGGMEWIAKSWFNTEVTEEEHRVRREAYINEWNERASTYSMIVPLGKENESR